MIRRIRLPSSAIDWSASEALIQPLALPGRQLHRQRTQVMMTITWRSSSHQRGDCCLVRNAAKSIRPAVQLPASAVATGRLLNPGATSCRKSTISNGGRKALHRISRSGLQRHHPCSCTRFSVFNTLACRHGRSLNLIVVRLELRIYASAESDEYLGVVREKLRLVSSRAAGHHHNTFLPAWY